MVEALYFLINQINNTLAKMVTSAAPDSPEKPSIYQLLVDFCYSTAGTNFVALLACTAAFWNIKKIRDQFLENQIRQERQEQVLLMDQIIGKLLYDHDYQRHLSDELISLTMLYYYCDNLPIKEKFDLQNIGHLCGFHHIQFKRFHSEQKIEIDCKIGSEEKRLEIHYNTPFMSLNIAIKVLGLEAVKQEAQKVDGKIFGLQRDLNIFLFEFESLMPVLDRALELGYSKHSAAVKLRQVHDYAKMLESIGMLNEKQIDWADQIISAY